MKDSNIEWTHHTFNGWLGCSKVSPGCDNCYAESWAKRYGTVEWGSGKPRKLTSDANWRQPVKWNAEAAAAGVRARVFCASLADVFDNEVPQEWRARLWDLIRGTPHPDWLLLTKRAGNIPKMLPDYWGAGWENVWIGISIVNQEEADRDIRKLIEIPARARFLSCEPLLGAIRLDRLHLHTKQEMFGVPEQEWFYDCLTGDAFITEGLSVEDFRARWLDQDFTKEWKIEKSALIERGSAIDWVIVGGESGTGARPMHPAWAQFLRDQCQAAGVPFLFKQWGEWTPGAANGFTQWPQIDPSRPLLMPSRPGEHGFDKHQVMIRVGKKAAGRILDGRTWDEFPEAA
jgi:protein gp37